MTIIAAVRIRSRPALAILVAIAALATLPASAPAFSKAIWGPLTVGDANQFPMYHQLGVSIYETGLAWDQVAPQRPGHPTDPNDPAYHWPADLGQELTAAAPFHIRVLVQLVHAPGWASGHSNPIWAPRNPADFAAFATAAARHYPSVHLWMVWGEPTRSGNFEPISQAVPTRALTARQKVAPHAYARMLDAVYGALKKVSRTNLVIGGDTYTTGMIDSYQWVENLKLPGGKPPRMDLYGINPFSYEAPTFHEPASPFDEVQFSDLPRFARTLDRFLKRGLPLFVSEWTIPTQADQEFDFWVDPALAAKWVGDALSEARAWRRIYALGWIHVYDSLPYSAGGLLTQNGQPKPDFYAFQQG